jgi:hypothetical protein
VLADNHGIAGGAVDWARVFPAAGLAYRVRLVGGGESDIPAAVAEAESLGARMLLAVGPGLPLVVGQAAAERLGLPLVQFEGAIVVHPGASQTGSTPVNF